MIKKLVTLLMIISSIALYSQTTHSVTLNWTSSIDATANPTGTYTIYRSTTSCTPVPTSLTKIGTAPATATTFTDANTPLGVFCYAITFTVNGVESLQSSPLTEARVLPAPPTGVLATVH